MKNRTLELIIGIVLLLVAAGAAWYGRETYVRSVAVQMLPVAIVDVPPYTMLTPEMFELREFPRAMSEGYALDTESLNGRISVSLIPAGLPVALALAQPVEQFRLAPPDQEVFAIPVSPVAAVGGKIQIGAQINLYRLEEPVFESGNQTEPAQVIQVASSVRVVAVLDDKGGKSGETEDGKTVPNQIVVLAAAPDVAQTILKLVAETQSGSNRLWATLATVEVVP